MIPAATLESALRASVPFPGGPGFRLWCRSIAGAVVAWVRTVQISGFTAGSAGAGRVIGTLSFSADAALVESAVRSAGFAGPVTPQLAAGLHGALSATFRGCPYEGQSTGVGSGTDLSRVTAADRNRLALLLAQHHAAVCAGAGGAGAQTPTYHRAVAAGVSAWWLTGTGNGTVTPTGPVTPYSATGVSLSQPV